MQARDAHPARIDDAAVDAIRTEREFMDALRVLKARSGLSYRDIAMRLSRAAPRHAMAKSTLAALFGQDTLPRRAGQLTAIVGVLAGELTESADLAAHYLAAWTRLMTARPARPGGTADASRRPEQAPLPAMPAVPALPPVPPVRYPASLPYQRAYREPGASAVTHAQAQSESGQAGGFLMLLAGGIMMSVITWLFCLLIHIDVSFWWIWLGWGGPILPLIALVPGRSGVSSSGELPAEYVRHEHRRATDRLPSWY